MTTADRSRRALESWLGERFAGREAWWLTATATYRMPDLEMARLTRRWLSSAASQSRCHIEVLIGAGIQPVAGLLHFHVVAAGVDGIVPDRAWVTPFGIKLDYERYDSERAAVAYTLGHDDYEVAVWCPRRKPCRRKSCRVARSGIPAAATLAGLASRARR